MGYRSRTFQNGSSGSVNAIDSGTVFHACAFRENAFFLSRVCSGTRGRRQEERRLQGVMAVWTDEETLKLLDLWGEDSIQAMLEGSRRNKDVFAKIAKEMKHHGYDKSAEQCAGKIKKLKFEYRKIRDKKKKTGEGKTEWKFFDPINNVLGEKPSTEPHVVIESTAASTEELPEAPGEEDELLCDIKESETKLESGSSSRSQTPAPVEKKEIKSKGKGKRKRTETVIERVEEVVEKVLKIQEESERNFTTMEEKMLEAEERRRRDNQEFMLQMMRMLAPPYSIPTPSSQIQMSLPTQPLTSFPTPRPPMAYSSTSTSPSDQVDCSLHPMYSPFTTPEHDS